MKTTQDTPRRDDPIAALAAPVSGLLPEGRDSKIMMITLLVLTVWAIAIATFGIPALLWPMKLIVPALVLGLVLLAWGK